MRECFRAIAFYALVHVSNTVLSEAERYQGEAQVPQP